MTGGMVYGIVLPTWHCSPPNETYETSPSLASLLLRSLHLLFSLGLFLAPWKVDPALADSKNTPGGSWWVVLTILKNISQWEG